MKLHARKLAEWFLVLFASRPNRFTKAVERLIFPWFPFLLGAIEFRRGNLTKARKITRGRKQSKVFLRSSQMLEVLTQGYSFSDRAVAVREFNQRVLFVLHSSPSFHLNGYSVRSCQILNTLQQGGISVVAATRLGYPWDLDDHKSIEKLDVSNYQGYLFHHRDDDEKGIAGLELEYISRYSRYLIEVVEKHRCSVVHSHSNFLNGIAGVNAARATGCLAVYEMRGLWHLTRASSDRAYEQSEHFAYCERMELEAANAADRVVAISAALANWLIEKGIDEKKIAVIGNAVEINDHPVPDFNRQRSTDRIEVGYVGALTKYEGLDTLIRATKILLDMNYPIILTIAGSGPYGPALGKIAAELGIQDRVRFLGRVPSGEVGALYEGFDVCPLPRARFAVTELIPPLKTFEIMLHGVPLVVSNLPPLTETVKENELGLVCQADSAASLAESIRILIEDPSRSAAMSKNAYEWVVKFGNWQTNKIRYENVYRGNSLSQPAT